MGFGVERLFPILEALEILFVAKTAVTLNAIKVGFRPLFPVFPVSFSFCFTLFQYPEKIHYKRQALTVINRSCTVFQFTGTVYQGNTGFTRETPSGSLSPFGF